MLESVICEIYRLHCNSEGGYCNVAPKIVINGLSDFLCVYKLLNVILIIILWYLNEKDAYF